MKSCIIKEENKVSVVDQFRAFPPQFLVCFIKYTRNCGISDYFLAWWFDLTAGSSNEWYQLHTNTFFGSNFGFGKCFDTLWCYSCQTQVVSLLEFCVSVMFLEGFFFFFFTEFIYLVFFTGSSLVSLILFISAPQLQCCYHSFTLLLFIFMHMCCLFTLI